MPVQDINDMRVWATCFSASCAPWPFLCQTPKIPLPQQNVFFLGPAFPMTWRIWQFSVWWAVLATWSLDELSSAALSLLESSSAPIAAFQMLCISSLQLAWLCFRALGGLHCDSPVRACQTTHGVFSFHRYPSRIGSARSYGCRSLFCFWSHSELAVFSVSS